MFLDSARILIQAGKGGAGCVSFRREKFVPKGGPDGGDGGRGGHIVFVARAQERTLIAFRFKRIFKAPKGRPGQGSNKTGASGKNLVINVPIGTVVIREETQEVVVDLVEAGQKAIVARGGRGGRGNTRFKSSTHQAPRESDPGGEGESGWFQLELKLLADVGLVGLPNAGKSTLLSVVSKARPKVASYPFTTLTPHLGVVSLSRHRAFVMADIPGLIKGAHMGAGLGDQFLKHVERTRVLIHLVDLADPISPPVERFEVVEKELLEYGAGLSEKPVIVVGTKADLTVDADQEAALRDRVRDRGLRYYRISAVTHKGLEPLLRAAWACVAPEEE
jgi:GTP-binding protein